MSAPNLGEQSAPHAHLATRTRRLWAWGLVALFLLLSVREYFDPYLVLFVDDLLLRKPGPLTLEMQDGIALHLYSDTRPHCGKIAALSKALVLVRDGRAVIEEGYGFGLPLIQYRDLVYNTRHAQTKAIDSRTLVKAYAIDVADRWSRFLQVKYQDVPPLGTVVVTYTVQSPTELRVDVDFTGLKVEWDTAYLMNEQGAAHFPIYEHSSGERTYGDEMGIWHPTDDPAGCWISYDEGLRFCVDTEQGRKRFVGRERYSQYNWVRVYALSWSGIDLQVDAPTDHYTYVLRIEPHHAE